ncbi:uncharacterized protein [Miscanthus floridulus]|uniref:uncharacterized protein n=1 Tax=Miscanthus floridulus TaxID=154761 RepID=UPI0034576CA7
MASASASWSKRWIRPEVYPLFVPMAAALGICSYQLVRNITGNPEVRVTKEKRAAGVLDNHEEGERYAMHGLRKFVRGKKPEIMASINSFFADPPKDD